MTFKRSFTSDTPKEAERRSGLNRRWIKAPYDGVDRRRGGDRRNESAPGDPFDPGMSAAERAQSLEKLLLSTTVRLEALTRLLVSKGVLSPEELADVLRDMQAEYQPQELKEE
jgi:hypothetical protein